MAIDDTKSFAFVSQALAEDTFAVVKFKGTEGISKLYEYDITLACDDAEIDLKGVLQNPATLTIKGSDQDFPIHGAIAEFEQLHEVKGHYFYRAILVPRLWQSDLYHENQLFLDKSVPDIIEEILKQTGLTTQDYELKLTRSYSQWEYICQYGETDFDFISRWMEREGIYYYFEQGQQNEKIIITDSSTAHGDIPGDAAIPYFPPSGFVPEEEAVSAFVCRQKMLPKKVILKDYNYRKPSLDLKTETEVDSKGRGDVYLYGEHFKDPGVGNELAKIRAEEFKCRENVFHGESTAPNLCPGFFFELEGYYREAYNQKYLIVEVEHNGHQTGSLWAGVGAEPAEGEQQLTYANRFSAIPSDVQYRPERKTSKPRFYGTMNATVDAAGDGQHAEIDDQGRYKVILSFDQSGNQDGKASRWVRMAQPYAGSDYGMHFPLHKGAEVLLTFVDGDPDRPIISGSVPNPDTISPVTTANQTKSVIRDNFGNEMIFDATPGDEHIRLYSPHHDSGLELGRSAFKFTTNDGADFIIGNKWDGTLGNRFDFLAGGGIDVMLGTSYRALLGYDYRLSLAGEFEWNLGFKSDFTRLGKVDDSNKDILFKAKEDFIIGAGDEFCLAAGTQDPDYKKNQNKNKSVMRATPDGITLGLGPQLTETCEGIGIGDWYDKTKKWDKLKESLFPLLSAGAGMTALIFSALHEVTGKEAKKVAFWPFSLVGLLINIATYRFARKFYAENLEDIFIEPVRHLEPPQKIWMHRNGSIGIVSTKGTEYRKKDGLGRPLAPARLRDNKAKASGGAGKIVIGVNQQINTSEKPEDWRYYDGYRDYGTKEQRDKKKKKYMTLLKELSKTKIGLVDGMVRGGMRQRLENYERAKQRLAEFKEQPPEQYAKLGEGSNIIIEKKNIKFRVGNPEEDKSPDKRQVVAIGEYENNKNGIQIEAGQASITVERDNEVRIKSKERFSVHRSKYIHLNAKNGIFLVAKEGRVKAKGGLKHKNWEVLAD